MHDTLAARAAELSRGRVPFVHATVVASRADKVHVSREHFERVARLPIAIDVLFDAQSTLDVNLFTFLQIL